MKLIELYDGNLFDCQMIKNLLEEEGIESFINNEIIGNRGGNIFRPGGGIKIVVSDESFDRARVVVDRYEKSHKE